MNGTFVQNILKLIFWGGSRKSKILVQYVVCKIFSPCLCKLIPMDLSFLELFWYFLFGRLFDLVMSMFVTPGTETSPFSLGSFCFCKRQVIGATSNTHSGWLTSVI